MSDETLPKSRTQQAGEFISQHLQEDIMAARDLPLRETSIKFLMSIIKVVVTIANLVFSGCQWGFSIILAAGDLLAKGLNKVLPAPKERKPA